MQTTIIPDLKPWSIENEPSKEMRYYDGYWDQILFVRDRLMGIFCDNNYDEYLKNQAKVINTHTSKSIKLPVYQISLEKYGVTLLLRDNFHGWKVSIESEKLITCDFQGLFDINEGHIDLYCEGFPTDRVYGAYGQINNKHKFTLELRNQYYLFTFAWMLMNYLKSR